MKLTKWEKRWIQALGTAFSPETAMDDDTHRLVPTPGEVDYADVFARINGPAGLKVRVGVRLAVGLFAASPLWHQGQLRTLDQLTEAERERLMAELSDHPLQLVRELALLMKVQVSMAKLGTASVRARSRYDHGRGEGTPVQLRRKAALEVA